MVSFIFLYAGLVFYNIGLFGKYKIPLNYWLLISFTFAFPINFYWPFAPFFVQILGENVMIESQKTICIKDVKKKVDMHKKLNDLFSQFLLIYFSSFQVLSVSTLFTGISQFISSGDMNMEILLTLIGMICNEGMKLPIKLIFYFIL